MDGGQPNVGRLGRGKVLLRPHPLPPLRCLQALICPQPEERPSFSPLYLINQTEPDGHKTGAIEMPLQEDPIHNVN